jgi:hypothetical protein
MHGGSNGFFFTEGLGFGNHPGGIQASGDIIVVPHQTITDGKKDDTKANGVSFYQLRGDGLWWTAPWLDISDSGGSAAGIAYHPVEDRWYVINGANGSYGPADHTVYRSVQGRALTDASNSFSALPNKVNRFGSQGAMQLMYDDTTNEMYLIALYRPCGSVATSDCDNAGEAVFANRHWMRLSTLFGTEEAVLRTLDEDPINDFFLTSPTFRFGGGIGLGASGNIWVAASERCIPGEPLSAAPCQTLQLGTDVRLWTKP